MISTYRMSEALLANVRTKDFSLEDLGYGVSEAQANLQFGLDADSEIDVNGFYSFGVGVPTRDVMPTIHCAYNLSWIKGRHSMSFGIDIYHNRVNELQNYEAGGNLVYSGQFTGSSAADFLIGDYSNFLQIGGVDARLRQTLPSFYAQDDIKPHEPTHRKCRSPLGYRDRLQFRKTIQLAAFVSWPTIHGFFLWRRKDFFIRGTRAFLAA